MTPTTTPHTSPTPAVTKPAQPFCWRCKGSYSPHNCRNFSSNKGKKSHTDKPASTPICTIHQQQSYVTVSHQQSGMRAFPFSASKPFPCQVIIPITIGSVNGRAIMDSGSSYTLLNEELWQATKEDDMVLNHWEGKPLYLADGGERWPFGWQHVAVKLQDHLCSASGSAFIREPCFSCSPGPGCPEHQWNANGCWT